MSEAGEVVTVEEVLGAQGEEQAHPEANGVNGTAEQGEGSSGGSGAPREEEEPWRKRLWFVRMPRPPEGGAFKGLEQEVDTYRTRFNLITEALNVKKVERDSAREATRSAREQYQQCRAAYDERAAPVRELQQQRQDAASSANKLKDSFSDLLAKSEAELDEQLRGLHYRIEHETISLNEEKKALATIKKLEQQRERVREYEASASLFAESRAKRSELQDVLKEHEGELKALRQEMDVQRQILDKLREHEREIDREVEEVIGERRRCREVMEQAYQRLTGMKKAQWEKNNIFYSNRGFSRTIRKMVEEGRLEEARDACAEQMEEAHEQLNSDDAFRSEYFSLWEQQRKAPVALSSDEMDALPLPSKGKKGAAKAKEEEPVDPAKKAEAAIAALLEEAKLKARAKVAAEREAASIAEKAAGKAAAEREAAEREAGEEEQEGAGEGAASGAPRQAAVREVVGLEAEAAAEAARAAARAHARAPKATPAARQVEPVVVPPENFILPEAVKAMKDKNPSTQELKELERERNRQAQAEAERRKAKKQQEKEKKRQRQEALAREAGAAAARAAEAAAAAQAAADAAAAVADDAAAASDSGSSDAGDTAGAAPAAAVPAGGSSSLEQRKKSGGGGSKGGAAKPAARRPPPAKQRGLVQQARKVAKDNSVPLVLGSMLLTILVLISLWWTANTVPQ